MKQMLLFVALVLLCASAHAQQDSMIVVNTHNSINCVTEKGEQGFAASSWMIGGTVGTGKPAGAPIVTKPALTDLVITKKFDACSAQLIRAFLSGQSFPMKKLTLIQYSPAKADIAYIPLVTVVLTDPIISSYTVSGAIDVNPVETLAFAYKSLCITSVSQTSEGTTTTPVTVCYDIASNKVN